MALGNMFQVLIWNTEVVTLDGGVHPPMDWAIVTGKKLVKYEDVTLEGRMAEMPSIKLWLVDLKDKVTSTKTKLQKVTYKGTQGRKMGEMGWIYKRFFDQGMEVGELEGFPS